MASYASPVFMILYTITVQSKLCYGLSGKFLREGSFVHFSSVLVSQPQRVFLFITQLCCYIFGQLFFCLDSGEQTTVCFLRSLLSFLVTSTWERECSNLYANLMCTFWQYHSLKSRSLFQKLWFHLPNFRLVLHCYHWCVWLIRYEFLLSELGIRCSRFHRSRALLANSLPHNESIWWKSLEAS